MRNVMGAFETIADVNRVITQLRNVDIEKSQISLLVRRKIVREHLAEYDRRKWLPYHRIGSIRGATLKGVLGLTAGIGTIIVPSIGALIVVGKLTPIFKHYSHNFISALTSLEIPNSEAEIIQQSLIDDHVVIAVHHKESQEQIPKQILEILRKGGATFIAQFQLLASTLFMAQFVD